jgi:hypothetical protein
VSNILDGGLSLENAKIELPWIKFTIELLSLGVYHERLVQMIFADDFLEEYMKRPLNHLDHIQLLSIVQILKSFYPKYKGPWPDDKFLSKGIEVNSAKKPSVLGKALELAYGGEEYVVSKIGTNLGHFLDHLVAFDESNAAISFNEKPENVEAVLQLGHRAYVFGLHDLSS